MSCGQHFLLKKAPTTARERCQPVLFSTLRRVLVTFAHQLQLRIYCEITGAKVSSCLIWLFRYLPTSVLVELTGFGKRYAVTLRSTQLSQKQPLCIGGQRRGPLLEIFSLDTEIKQAEHAAEL